MHQQLDSPNPSLIQELYNLQTLRFREDDTENGVMTSLANSIDQQIIGKVGEIFSEDDRLFRFVIFRSGKRKVLCIVDQLDPERKQIRYHDQWHWRIHLIIEICLMIYDSIDVEEEEGVDDKRNIVNTVFSIVLPVLLGVLVLWLGGKVFGGDISADVASKVGFLSGVLATISHFLLRDWLEDEVE